MEFVIAALVIVVGILCYFGEVHASLIEALKTLIAAPAAARAADKAKLYAEAAEASKARYAKDRTRVVRMLEAAEAVRKQEELDLLCALHRAEYPQAWDNSLRGGLVDLQTKRGVYSLHWEDYKDLAFAMLKEDMQK